jgi:nucleoside-diphosphate-sugar epimerase
VLSNNEDLIAVISATGQQGGAVVRALQASGQFKVRALTRNPGKHRDLAEEIVEADLDRSKQRRGPWCTASIRAWVSNVHVPPSMSPRNAQPRLGGIVLLDLTTSTTTAVAQVPDANGIAVTSVSSSFARNTCSSAGNAVD